MGLSFGFSNGAQFASYAFLFWIGGKLVNAGKTDFQGLMVAMFAILFGTMGTARINFDESF